MGGDGWIVGTGQSGSCILPYPGAPSSLQNMFGVKEWEMGQEFVKCRALWSRLPWALLSAVLFRVWPGHRHFVFPATLSMHTTRIATQALDLRAVRSARNVTNQEHDPRP